MIERDYQKSKEDLIIRRELSMKEFIYKQKEEENAKRIQQEKEKAEKEIA